MKKLINELIGENFNGLRTIIAEYPEDTKTIMDALEGKIPFNSDIMYHVLSIINITNNNGTLLKLRETLKNAYYQGKINSFNDALQDFYELFPDLYTDLNIVREQIEDYEKNYQWSPEDRFLFPANGLGNYALLVIFKLMNSKNVIEKIPNDVRRYKHILENQIFVVDKKAINNFCFAATVDIGNEFNKNIFTGDFLSTKFDRLVDTKWGYFTAVFGTPIFSERNIIEKRSTNFIYHKYILKSIEIARITMLLTPSRWFQTKSGDFKYLKKFRENMMKSNKISWLNYIPMDPDPEHTGGLSYFIYDNEYEYEGRCHYKNSNKVIDLNKLDIILTDIRCYSLINKVKSCYPLTIRYIPSSWAGIKTTDNRLFPERINEADIKVYVSPTSQHTLYDKKERKGYMWISDGYLMYRRPHGLDKWKVFTGETATAAGRGFTDRFRIAEPGEIFTQTFCGFYTNTEVEANNLISYLRTNFVNKLISMRKIKNHINDDTLAWVPMVPLDREWNNELVETYFKLTTNEKNLING